MTKKPNPLSSVEPWDLVAAGYTETTMPAFEPYAREAIQAACLRPGSMILDVACGPGTLSVLVAPDAAAVHAIDFSSAMIQILQQHIERNGLHNITARQGDGQALPYEDNQFDAAFSLFGLMFFPDRRRGFSEIFRALKPRGRIIVTSWAPVDQSPAMQLMFGAIRTIKPDLPEPQRVVDSLENRDTFERELYEAGFVEVQVMCVNKAAFPVMSVPRFWYDMVKGSAPIQMLKKGLGESVWQEREPLALRYLEQMIPVVPTTLSSNAWVGRGVKPP